MGVPAVVKDLGSMRERVVDGKPVLFVRTTGRLATRPSVC